MRDASDSSSRGAARGVDWSDADAALEALHGAHWHGLVRLAWLLVHDRQVAEEVVQDAFVAVHRRWRRLRDPDDALAYLRTAVLNGARSALRRRGVEQRHRPLPDPAPAGPEERAVRAEEDARVLAALRRLPRRQQEVLVLRYYADLSEHEIAEALGIGRGTVKSSASRGIAALRADLEAVPW